MPLAEKANLLIQGIPLIQSNPISVSTKFGYGMMDAGAIVDAARDWQTVPMQSHCEVELTLADG